MYNIDILLKIIIINCIFSLVYGHQLHPIYNNYSFSIKTQEYWKDSYDFLMKLPTGSFYEPVAPKNLSQILGAQKQQQWIKKFQGKHQIFQKKLLILGMALLVFNGLIITFFGYLFSFFLNKFFPYLRLALTEKVSTDPKYKEYETLLNIIIQSMDQQKSLDNLKTNSFWEKSMLNFCKFIVFNLRDLVKITDSVFEYSKAVNIIQVVMDFFRIANVAFSAVFLMFIAMVNGIFILWIIKSNTIFNTMKKKYLKNKIKKVSLGHLPMVHHLKSHNFFLKNMMFNYKYMVPDNSLMLWFFMGFMGIFYINFIFLNPRINAINQMYQDKVNNKAVTWTPHLFWDPLFLMVVLVFISGFLWMMDYKNKQFMALMGANF